MHHVGGDQRPARAPPAQRPRPRRSPLPRAARPGGARARRQCVAAPLQPQLPAGVRRDALPVPAHAPAPTPSPCLPPRRLERARYLLRTTDRSVMEICLDVGFTSVGSFTTTFRRHVGVTPTAYRRANP